MARRKIKMPTPAKQLQALNISTNLIKGELVDLSPKLQNLRVDLKGIRDKLDRVMEVQEEQPENPMPFSAEQFEQLRMAVNKIAAYAAAMDETKKTMIKLTSKRINKLDARITKLRVRLKRLNG